MKIMIFFLSFIYTFGQVSISYKETKEGEKIRTWLEKTMVIEEVVELINKEVNIEEEINIEVGRVGGPYYDPNERVISLPYGFIIEVSKRFKRDFNNWEIYTEDNIRHTLYHEIGHALIDILGIPVLGKEEDAVDDFGILMLILTKEDGADMGISVAELFFMEGEDIEEYGVEEFMDVHSLDEQRAYRSLCMVYGSDPLANEDIARDLELDQGQRDECIEVYSTQVYNWLFLLEPHLNKGTLNRYYQNIQ